MVNAYALAIREWNQARKVIITDEEFVIKNEWNKKWTSDFSSCIIQFL